MQMKAGLMLFRAILIALPPETKQNLQISPKKMESVAEWSRFEILGNVYVKPTTHQHVH